MSNQGKIQSILEVRLKEIYGEKMQNIEIINTMPYPLKDNLFIVRYNIDLKNEVPIRRAQIVVNILTEELLEFKPDLP